MRTHHPLFRLTAAATIAALALPSAPIPAFAQPAPPADAAPQQTADPPARVGRLTLLRGTVSFHGPSDTQWSAAVANYPIAAGDTLWTDTDAGASVEVSASRISLAGGTELDLATLDTGSLQATLAQGEAYIRLRNLAPDEAWTLQTPRGSVTFNGPGRFLVSAGTTDGPTLVTALEGTAQLSGPGVDLQVEPDQTATITGADTFQATIGPAQRDAFLDAMLARERPPARPSAPPPPAVAAMPGGEDLAAYGAWSEAPDYGQVWYPQVSSGWAPYRDGHWAYVAPWGWTWIDDAPWGFAPFHYGRWVEVGGRWGWTPGVVAEGGYYQPVYAPALVTFFDVAAGVAVGVGLGAALAAGSIGWFPLGPREAYRPWYHASDRYLRQVNVGHVTNITTINRNVTINNYVNRRAAIMVPANAMQGSRPIGQFARPVPAQTLATARPVFGQQPLRPSMATVGVTPAVARQMHLSPAPGTPIRQAPGPAIRAQAVGPGAAAIGRPPLQPANRPDAAIRPDTLTRPDTLRRNDTVARPGTATRPPGTPLAAPQHGLPPLVTPGPHAAPPPGGPAGFDAHRPPLPGNNAGRPPIGTPGAAPQLQRPEAAPAAPTVAHVPPAAVPQVVHPAPVPVPRTAPPQAPFREPGQLHQPAPGIHAPPAQTPQVHAAPPQAPQVQAPQFHAPPPQAPQVHAPPPQPQPPQVHAAPPMPQMHQPQPQPQFHPPQPQPQPQMRQAPPEVHAAPPPAQHAAPPPPPQHKRPGEP